MTNRLEENGDAVDAASEMTDPSQMIRQLREQQCRQCWSEVQEVLKRHNCQIIPVTTIRGNQIDSAVSIIPVN